MTRMTTLSHVGDESCSPQSAAADLLDAVDLSGSMKPPDSLELLLSVYDTLLDRFMPPLILINAQRRVIDTFSGADRFLRFGSRRPSEDVLELLVEPLRHPVAKAFSLCCSTGQAVITEPIEVHYFVESPVTGESESLRGEPNESRQSDERGEAVSGDFHVFSQFRVRVTPVPHRKNDSAFFSLAFESSSAKASELGASDENGPTPCGVSYPAYRGYGDFARMGTSLVLEKGAVESVASPVGSNWGVSEYGSAAAGEPDWESLFESSGLAIIFLDAELQIRRFSGPAGKIFGLLPHDIGRAMRTFAGNLESSDLIDRLTQAVRTGDCDEFEIHQAKRGGYYLARIVPLAFAGSEIKVYRGDVGPAFNDGVALTLIDLSTLDEKRQEVHRLSSIVQSSADAIISRDSENRIITWNAAAEDLYGYAANEAIGESVSLIVPEAETEEHQNSQRVFRRDPHVNHFDASRRNKRGELLRVSVRLSPVYDDDNRIVGISTIERDISAKAAMADQLSQSEKMLEAFYDRSPEICCSIDASSGLVTACNDSMCRQLGLSREEIAGRSIIDLQTEACRERVRECLERLKCTGMLHGEELELRRKDGSALPVSLCATAIYDRDGRIVGGRAVWRDLTPLKAKDELIRQGETRYRNSFQNSAIGIAHCDLNGRYILANRRLCEIVGYSYEELS